MYFPFATQFRRLQISIGESPAYSKYRVYPSIKPTQQRPQLQPTQQQPKLNFITSHATPTVQTPPPTIATTFAYATSTAAATSASHALPPTTQVTQPTQQLK
ncbi:hypothetical protein Adt_01996 [Abeliophyllum distichum]|uniref:Uncharacterized protein n=1 Tax=Abeliophyllum distichum TaxID=126358 RepID=A0ABD1VUI7_9LAMI